MASLGWLFCYTMYRLVMMQDQIDFSLPVLTNSDGKQSEAEPDDSVTKSALDRIDWSTGRKAVAVFKIWGIVFALVDAQMSWALRPFIGSPGMVFAWFRRHESHFFLDVTKSIGELFGA